MKHWTWFVLLTVGSFLLAAKVPTRLSAWTEEDWQTVGDSNQQWTIKNEQITGLADEQNRVSWLILNENLHQVSDNFIFQLEFTPLQGADHNLVWNFLDYKNYYQAHFNGGALWVTRFIDNQGILSVAKNFPLTWDQTYALKISQLDRQISVNIDGVPIITFADWTHNSLSHGQVGFKLAPGSITPVESQFNKVKVSDPALTVLPVELIKQTSSPWGDLIYDSAQQWSGQPTISRWGCALTSLTMVMRSYGLVTMPDGSSVTPAAVNAWLLSEPDGYIGQGLLNWWAGTRLIAQISEQYSTAAQLLPKLEFSYQAIDWQTRLRQELDQQHPAIVQLPGHFVVVHGFSSANNDFLIHDPFYDFTQLGQHPPALSLRLFTPSQTDLSAIVIAHRPNVTIALTNQANQPVGQTWTEWLESDPEEERITAWQFTVINQPADGTYHLLLEGAQADGDVQILAYNQSAKVQTLTPAKSEVNDFAQLNLKLQFNKTTGATLDQFSWDTFLTQLSATYHDQLIDQPTFTRLQMLVKLAGKTDQTSWPRYKTYLKNILALTKNQTNLEKINELQVILQE